MQQPGLTRSRLRPAAKIRRGRARPGSVFLNPARDPSLAPKLSVAPGLPLRDTAYAQIKDMIVSNTLPPGTLISIDHFVRALQISRTPVREALLRLQGEHLVEILPQRAIRVKDISPVEVRELFAVREVLECAAVENACRVIPDELLRRLDADIASAESDARTKDTKAFVRTDLQLHDLINANASNTLITEILGMILDRARRVQVFSGVRPREVYVKQVTKEHRSIIAAMRRRDKRQARRLLAKHLRNAAARIQQQLRGRARGSNPRTASRPSMRAARPA